MKMKSALLTILLSFCGASLPAFDLSNYLDRLEVRKIEIDIVWPYDFLAEEFWKKYSETPAANIGLRVDTTESDAAFDFLSAELVRKAKDLGLDFEGLSTSLRLVRLDDSSKISKIPVCAYQYDQEGKTAWMIICNWEYSDFQVGRFTVPGQENSPKSETPIVHGSLGHIAMWCVSPSDSKILAFASCD